MQLPDITNRQSDIMDLIYRFRFLHRGQIQHFLNHKYHRTILLWLNDLVTKGYLNRIYSRTFPDNTKPAVYYLGTAGLRYLRSKGKDVPHTLYREAERTASFRERCLLLADIAVEFEYESMSTRTLELVTRPLFDESGVGHFLAELKPDAFVTTITVAKRQRHIQHSLLLLFEDDLLLRLRLRIKQYLIFCDQFSWQAELSEPFPTILIVAPNPRVRNYLAKYIRKIVKEREIGDVEVELTLRDELQHYGFLSHIWERMRLRQEDDDS